MRPRHKLVVAGIAIVLLAKFGPEFDAGSRKPLPIAGKGLRVCIMEETAERSKLPAEQLAIFTSQNVRDYLNEKCAKVNDKPEYRVFDVNTSMENESKIWQDAMKQEYGSLPWLLISNGRKGASQALPKTVDEMMEVLKKYGD